MRREDEALVTLRTASKRPPGIMRRQGATWPSVIAAAILVVVSWPFVIAVITGPEDPQHPLLAGLWMAQNTVRLSLFFLGLGTLFWVSATALLRLMGLGRQPLQLKPLEDDGLLGLRPAGRLALRVA